MKKTTQEDRSKFFISKGLYKAPLGEINNEPSCTIQGESYSIEDLVIKGISAPVGRVGYYDDDEDLDENSIDLESISRMDIAERHELMQRIGQRIQELQDTAKKLVESTKPTQQAEIVQKPEEK